MSRSVGVFVRGLVRGTGELLVTAGALVLLFAVYLVVWSDVRTAAAQSDLRADFAAQTAAVDRDATGTPAKIEPIPGQGIAEMTIPRLGEDWRWVVVEGVVDADIAKGPGHFPGTAQPGQLGNFAVAGHRATHGEPFAYLDAVVPGDHIVVRTAAGWSVYTVTLTQIVPPTRTDLIDPVPGQPDGVVNQALITLVTCHPRWGSSERLIVTGLLSESRSATQGPPTIEGY